MILNIAWYKYFLHIFNTYTILAKKIKIVKYLYKIVTQKAAFEKATLR